MATRLDRSSASRRGHLGLLAVALALIVTVSFWPHESPVNRLGLGVVVALGGWGLARTRDAGHLERVRVEDPLLAMAGAICSLVAARGLGVAPILSATSVGVLGGWGVRWFKGARDYHGAPWYAGAFVGITSPLVFANFWWIVLAGLVTGFLWSISRAAWVGIGGKMGTVSLIAATSVAFVARWLHQRGPGAAPLDVRGIGFWVTLVGVAGASLTFWLSHQCRWGAVLGSAAPTAAFSFAMALGHSWTHGHGEALSYVWYGSSFVGMTTPTRLRRPSLTIPAAGLVFAWMASRFGPALSGLGGTAGVTALIAVFAVRGASSHQTTLPGSADATTNLRTTLGGDRAALEDQ